MDTRSDTVGCMLYLLRKLSLLMICPSRSQVGERSLFLVNRKTGAVLAQRALCCFEHLNHSQAVVAIGDGPLSSADTFDEVLTLQFQRFNKVQFRNQYITG